MGIVKMGIVWAASSQDTQFTLDLHSVNNEITHIDKMVDDAKVKYICDIYDWDGKGQIDEEGKKFAKYDDVVEKVKAAVATPDSQGTYGDYLELLKLYDKNSNGTMMLAELDNILC